MKTILVTGGAGFIGSNYIQHTLQTHADVHIINYDALTYAGNLENLKSVQNHPRYTFIHGDVCNAEDVQKLFAAYPIDYVVNFAAETHVDRSIYGPEAFVRANVLGTMVLLGAAKQAWQIGDDVYKEGCKYLQVSTDEVYGSLGPTGLFSETSPLDAHSPYSASKTSADLMVKAYHDTYRFPANITRCSNNYGPYQFPEKLIPLMIYNAIHGRPLPIYGDGLQIRDWLFVLDHCSAINAVLFGAQPGQVYNIGGNNECTNLAIVNAILTYCHEHVDAQIGPQLITHVTDRKGHDRRYAIDATKIKTDLGWTPQYTFDKALPQTIDWYLQNQDWLNNVTSGEYKNYYSFMYDKR